MADRYRRLGREAEVMSLIGLGKFDRLDSKVTTESLRPPAISTD